MDHEMTVNISRDLLESGHGGTLHGARYAPRPGRPEWYFWADFSRTFEDLSVAAGQLLSICPEVEPYLDLPAGTSLTLYLDRPRSPEIRHDEFLLTNEPDGRRRADAPMRVLTGTPSVGPHTSNLLATEDRSIEEDLQKFASILQLRQMQTRGTIRGCRDQDLEALRQIVSFVPEAYECFLRLAGRQAADLWIGTDAFFPDIVDLDLAVALEVCASDYGVALPAQDRLVFSSHQGYDFLWMDLSTRVSNPPVWQFGEGDDSPPSLLSCTFTGWLLHSAECHLQHAQRFRR